MNTIRSTWIGWGTLTVAGAGAYYFAKKSIDADKKERFENQQKRRQMAASLEAQATYSRPPKAHPQPEKDVAVGSSNTQHQDAAPSKHKPRERSKYEPSEVYRTKKGDRFS